MEKLLVRAVMQRVVDHGYDYLAGPVVRAADHAGRSAAERVAAHGLEGDLFPFGPDPDHVDVIRFETTSLMLLSTPTDVGERPWPTYPLGFLRDGVPVWNLDLTRVPTGARFLRVARDGTEREFSVHEGPALGWRGAKGYFPPVHLIGPRARWRDLDLPAGISAAQDVVELVWVGEGGAPDGFRQMRPNVYAREVPSAECELFEVVVTARWREAGVRVLQQVGEESLVVLLEPDLDSINRLGAVALEPHLFQATAPTAEVTELGGVVREPAETNGDADGGSTSLRDQGGTVG